MPKLVVFGAQLKCSEGLAPAVLQVAKGRESTAGSRDVATVADHAPNVNVMPFGMCKTQSNPQVAAATTAAQGVLTPQPCVPVIAAPWSPGAKEATLGGVAVLTADSTCSCAWAGKVEVVDPGSDVDVE